MDFAFTIPGKAAPKGSRVAGVTKTGVRFNRESNPHVQIWMRHAKATLTTAACEAQHIAWDKDTPLAVTVTFYVERPKKPTYEYPSRGDVDKLCRSLLDACTGIVWADDSQVVHLEAVKAYADTASTDVVVTPLELAA